jgi:hypothetical protein
MHIILGILGSIITILILLKRLSDAGIDVGWLDPFKWQRRKQWKQRVSTTPLYLIKDPMEATASLMYAMAKCSGDISLEEKNFLLEKFKGDFFLSDNEASSLLNSCSFVVTDCSELQNNIPKFFSNSVQQYTDSQIDSTIELIEQVANLGGGKTETQSEFLDNIINYLKPAPRKTPKWS